MKRVNLENGNYAIVYYYNDNNESVEETVATKCTICEFDINDKLVKEGSFVLETKKEEDEISLEDNSNFPVFKK